MDPEENAKIPPEGLAPVPPEEGKPSEYWDENLPSRLFATGRYPVASLNVYSKLDHLTFIHHYLKDSPVMDQIRNTCFGKLFDIPSPRCPTSGKLIHQLITRQLITKKNHELWMVFGGHPIRFGLPEFAQITGLPCGEFEEECNDKDTPQIANAVDDTWREIVGDDANTTIGDIADLFQNEESFHSMSDDRKFKLALILIVDGVLVAKHQFPKPTPRYVSMLSDVPKFLRYPWGRESFLCTLETMRPQPKRGNKLQDPISKFRRQLCAVTMRLQGFPLALQLLAFKNIPILLNWLPSPAEDHTLFHIIGNSIPIHAGLKLNDVLLAETHPALHVAPYLTTTDSAITEQYNWDGEVTDNRVVYLQKKIQNGESFSLSDWPHGDASLEPIFPKPPKTNPGPHKKHILNRRKRKNNDNLSNDPTPPKKNPTTTPAVIIKPSTLEEIQTLKAQVAELIANQKRFERERMFYRTQRIRQWRRRPSVNVNTKSRPSTSTGTQTTEINDGLLWPSHWEDLPLKESFGLRKDHTSIKAGHPANSGQTKDTHTHEANLDDVTVGLSKHNTDQVQLYHTSIKAGHPANSGQTKDTHTHEANLDDVTVGLSKHNTDQVQLYHTSIKAGHPANSGQTKDTHTHEANLDDVTEGLSKHNTDQDHLQSSIIRCITCVSETDDQEPNYMDSRHTSDISLTPQNVGSVDLSSVVQETAATKKDKHFLPKIRLRLKKNTDQSSHIQPILGTANDGTDDDSENYSDDRIIRNAMSFADDPLRSDTNQHSHTSTESEAHLDTVLVSDSSPPPQKIKHTPTDMEIALSQVLREQEQIQHLNCIRPFQGHQFDMLEEILKESPNVEHYTDCGFLITNTLLLDLATPQKWVSTLHMEVLMSWIARRQFMLPASEAGALCSPMLINRLLAKSKDFYAAKNKKRLRWDQQISLIVNAPGRTWVQDTDTVYVPMILDNKHWVGLAINLSVGCIEVLDPNPDLISNKKLARYLKPILDMLPYVVDKFCPQASQPRGLQSYTWKAIKDLYKNLRGGDCGPLSVKFMEMHAAGDPEPHMSGLTDEIVTQFRKQYTLDLYKEVIMPLYL